MNPEMKEADIAMDFLMQGMQGSKGDIKLTSL